MSVKKRRVLILTSSTGGGHDARARFLNKWFEHLYPNEVEVRIEQILEGHSQVGNFGVNFHNKLQVWGLTSPFIYLPYWYFLEIFGGLFKFRILLGKRYYEKVIKEFKPHLIISVHDFTNKGYFETARRLLNNKVRCATVCSELTGGFGYSWNWINPSVDLFISTTQASHNYALKHKIKSSKALIHGTYLSPEEYKEVLTEEQIKKFRAQELHLHPEKFTLLLATGANGANHHIRLLNALRGHFRDINIIAICGKNKEAHKNIINWKLDNEEAPLKVFSFTHELSRLIQCSDAVVAQGGANTSLMTLYHKKPIIFNLITGLMPQEKATVRFFKERRACGSFSDPEKLSEIVEIWKEKGFEYFDVCETISRSAREDNPKPFIEKLYKLSCLTD